MTSFQLLRNRQLSEMNGTDLWREPIGVRKATLASTLRKSRRLCLDYSPSGSGHSTMSTCPQSMH